VGKNQNTIEEIDVDYVREHGIPVIRRQSGGGAVFHDLGNINYTIIHQMGEDDFGGYEKFTAPVCAHLRTLGVDAHFGGRNDLLIDGMKFSGNAQAVHKGRIMHHGCILFDADFGDLASVLRPKQEKIESKGIKSVRSRVTNICAHLSAPMTPEEYYSSLADFFRAHEGGLTEYALTPEDVAATQMLAEEKYATWAWNYGHSPAYGLSRAASFPFGQVDVRLDVSGGHIRQAAIFGDFFGLADKAELETLLIGVRHEPAALAAALAAAPIGQYIHGMTADDLVTLLR